jgi:hypothetical protein
MKAPALYTAKAKPYHKRPGGGCDAANGAISTSAAHAIVVATKARRKRVNALAL